MSKIPPPPLPSPARSLSVEAFRDDLEEGSDENEEIQAKIENKAKEMERIFQRVKDLDHVGNLFQDKDMLHRDDHFGENFQRVTISSEGVEVSQESKSVASAILDTLALRDKYQVKKPVQYWGGINQSFFESKSQEEYEAAIQTGATIYRRRLNPPFEPFNDEMYQSNKTPESVFGCDLLAEFVDGVMVVQKQGKRQAGDDESENNNLFPCPSQKEFYDDLGRLVSFAHEAKSKSFCFQRLQLLDAKFNLHGLLNSEAESSAQKRVPHRDFYNVRKVDTHIHHSAIMNQKHLLRFIKHKLKKCPNEVVVHRDGKYLTLEQVFHSLHLTAYRLSIDTLDMHADNTFHRFDRFNLKYNPVGESRLREIFLKTDNLIAGRYLAEVTKEVFSDAEANKYVLMEPRVSIYGRKPDEWTKLAAWYQANKLSSNTIRWMIQIPRLYSIYKSMGLVTNFQNIIDNVFKPLFEVTLDPSSDPDLDVFLRQVVGFDCVDDESKFDRGATVHEHPVPTEWTGESNPPYSYWVYYIYANLRVLNELRAKLNMTTFSFRPHCGEAGDLNNLASSFLCAEQINHGIMLRKSPTLQYLYYLAQIGMALSPLSNNKLFLDYHANPFPQFFARGLNVSLSTDDPLMLHITKEPLVEEYSVASQVWKLSSTDMCEIARNSVLQSGFEHPYKVHFLGENYHLAGPEGNTITQTNVPNVRVKYRQETLEAEWNYLEQCKNNTKLVDPQSQK